MEKEIEVLQNEINTLKKEIELLKRELSKRPTKEEMEQFVKEFTYSHFPLV